MNTYKICACLFFLLVTTTLPAQQTLFPLVPPDSCGVHFINQISDTKKLNVISYEYYYNGGGVAIGDVNNDGLPDIYFTANTYGCMLYLNKGNFKFEDVTARSGVDGGTGYHTGVVMVDINNDSWLDIYVCRSVLADPKLRQNILYVNNHDGTFTDKAAEYGIADDGFATQAYFHDMDSDNDLDLLVLNHPYNLGEAKTIHLAYNKKKELVAVKDEPNPYESGHYYENINGHYVNKTKEAGLSTRAFTLSAILQDFNGDGKPDIYQANDYLEPDYLFINQGNGRFKNEFDKYFRHGSYSSMGTDFADLNNDGLSDLLVDDMLAEGNFRQKQLRRGNNYDEFEKTVKYGYGYQYTKNVVQLNNGNNSFSDISYYTGMAFSDWSWAILAADFDNDMNKDVYVANGYMRDITDMDYSKYFMDSLKKELVKKNEDRDVLALLSLIPSVKIQNYYFKNNGGLLFNKENKESGLAEYAWSFGAAYADLDNDGDLDMVVNNVNDYPFIYRNNTRENNLGNYIRLKLAGPSNNRNSIGAAIETVTPDGTKQHLVSNPMKGYLSCHDNVLIIGLGKNNSADLTITWPDGKQLVLKNTAANQEMTLNYSSAKDAPARPAPSKKLFEDITAQTKLNFTYQENNHIDFKLEPLLPHRFSQSGPCMAVGDLNGDSLEDVYIGGAKGFAGVIYFQETDGTFEQKNQPAFAQDKLFEDGAAAIFDADGDGDKDLLISCGGNEYANQNNKYPVRLYFNKGDGTFSKAPLAGDSLYTSACTMAIGDYNKDGMTDVFVGGRVVPGHYGLIPPSFLLTGNAGGFAVTDHAALSHIGMVTTAVWTDVNGDAWPDLVLAGEWMPITIFLNNNGALSAQPVILENTFGWWNRILSTDMDNDGDQDLVCGNLGMNTRYQGTVEKPVTMVVSDFDDNGSTDCMISIFIKDRSYPIAIRDYVLDQMPYLRKKFLRYKQYSTATIDSIFTPAQLAKAVHFKANDMTSSVFFNDGHGNFTKKQLPTEAQWFPVNGIQAMDVNEDGRPDLLLSGNDYSTEVETGRNDAGIGLVLINQGDREFRPLPVTQSGFYTPGNVKCLEKINLSGRAALLVGKNSDKLQVIRPLK